MTVDREQTRRDAKAAIKRFNATLRKALDDEFPYLSNQEYIETQLPHDMRVVADAYLALLTELEHSTEALKAIAEVAFIANEGDPWYCEHEGIDTERAYRLYREATATEAT